MGLVVADDGWRIPDKVWAQMELLLPERPAHPLGCHNPRVPDRDAMNAILFVLRTGCQWNALDSTGICSCSSAYRRFREWTQAGVFLKFWKQDLTEPVAGRGARVVRRGSARAHASRGMGVGSVGGVGGWGGVGFVYVRVFRRSPLLRSSTSSGTHGLRISSGRDRFLGQLGAARCAD